MPWQARDNQNPNFISCPRRFKKVCHMPIHGPIQNQGTDTFSPILDLVHISYILHILVIVVLLMRFIGGQTSLISGQVGDYFLPLMRSSWTGDIPDSTALLLPAELGAVYLTREAIYLTFPSPRPQTLSPQCRSENDTAPRSRSHG